MIHHGSRRRRGRRLRGKRRARLGPSRSRYRSRRVPRPIDGGARKGTEASRCFLPSGLKCQVRGQTRGVSRSTRASRHRLDRQRGLRVRVGRQVGACAHRARRHERRHVDLREPGSGSGGGRRLAILFAGLSDPVPVLLRVKLDGRIARSPRKGLLLEERSWNGRRGASCRRGRFAWSEVALIRVDAEGGPVAAPISSRKVCTVRRYRGWWQGLVRLGSSTETRLFPSLNERPDPAALARTPP